MEQRAPASAVRRYTPAEYLRISAATDQLLDYWDGIVTDRAGNPIEFDASGQVVDMAGAQPNHGCIAANFSREMGNALKGTPCGVLDSSVAVRLGRGNRAAHPDVTVCCGDVELDADSDIGPVILNPHLVVEVLSPTTQDYDQTAKADGYRAIDSLREYVLVRQDRPRVETFYRNADVVWSIGGSVTDLAASVTLRSLDVSMPMAEIYARATLAPPAV